MVIPLYSVSIPDGIGTSIEAVLQSGRIAAGEHVLQFEDRLKALIGSPLLLATGEMSSSLVMCLYLAGVRPGDEVVASPLSCVAANAPICNLFATAKWCDCDPHTGSMDPEFLKRIVSPKTKAILVSHWAGNPAELDAIYEVARAHGLPVVEDASEALGASYHGASIGNTGADFVVFSFYPNRHLTTMEGGAISFRDPDMFDRCRWLRRYGIHQPSFRTSDGEINPESDIKVAGWNSYMNQISAVVGLSQFVTLEERLKVWRSNGAFYDRALKGIPSIELLHRPKHSESAFWVYTLLAKERDRMLSYLCKHGVQTSRVHIRNDIYSCFGSEAADLAGVREFSEKSLSIPCGWWVSEFQRQHICDLIGGFH
jgi:perosamine synthetase